MKTSSRQHHGLARRAGLGVLVTAAALGAGGCHKTRPEYAGQRADSVTIPTALRDSIHKSIAALHFDSTPPAAQTETLQVAGFPRAIATIAPEHNALHLGRGQLVKGVIIARITSDSAFPPLGIAAGHTYYWVDSTREAGWRALLVPEAGGPPVYGLPMQLNPRVVPDSTMPATGRWLALPTNSIAYFFNGRCGNTCCVTPAPTALQAGTVDSAFASYH